MSPSGFKDLVRRFYDLQAERLEAYRLLEEGHKAYLRTGPHYDFEHYRQLVQEITKAFSGVSKELMTFKETLHQDFGRHDLVKHITKLQIQEKQKLELTAKMQLAKQSVQDNPEEEDYPHMVRELKQEIMKNQEALSEIMQDFKYDAEDSE